MYLQQQQMLLQQQELQRQAWERQQLEQQRIAAQQQAAALALQNAQNEQARQLAIAQQQAAAAEEEANKQHLLAQQAQEREAEGKRALEQARADAAYEAKMEAAAQDEADRVAAELRGAMKGFGTNEKRMIAAMAPASSRVLALSIHSFQRQFNRSLLTDIKDETSGSFEDACIGLFATQADMDARSLYKAMDGLGTDEDRLDEVLLFRSGVQLRKISDTYRRIYQTELLDDLADECSTNHFKLYQTILTERVPHNEFAVEQDVKYLYDAGIGKTFGTDEETFARVLGMADPAHIIALSQCYANKYGHSLAHAIDQEFGSISDDGDLKRSMKNILMGYGDFIGMRLHKSMKGLGTDDKMLQRLIFSHREEPGLLKAASDYLLNKTGHSLLWWIKDETSGDYKKLMVAVCEANGCTA
jgi:annexin A7/11